MENDKEDSYRLAKLLRLGELPEVYLPSRYSDDLRSLARYRKSLGEEITMLKNRVLAILSSAGIRINATDIFGKRGMVAIFRSANKLSTSQRFVLNDLMDRITYLMRKESTVEDEISRSAMDDRNVDLLMTIPGIGIYSAAAIMSEIDDISRFKTKEKLASYAGLVPRQNQSGTVDIRGHITKRGPSMLRFISVNATHPVIKYSKRMKKKYLSPVRRLGKNPAMVTIARILIETIHVMLSRGMEFIDQISPHKERKRIAMSVRARRPFHSISIEDQIKNLMDVRKERQRRARNMEKINNREMIT